MSSSCEPNIFPKMPPRKQHLKSRNGCWQCKRRKIKCDEKLPLCGPCLKHRISCSFEGRIPSTPLASTSCPPPDLQYASPISSTSMLDLELLQNFTSRTYCTLSASIVLSPTQKEFYRTEFVQEALAHDYFTHALLAVSAFHLVFFIQRNLITTTKPIETYLIAAHTHYNTALRSFRSTLFNVTAQNCSAVFGCAILITLISFAQPQLPDSSPSDSPKKVSALVLDWFRLLRGMEPVHRDFKDLVENGSLKPIFESRVDYGTGPIDSELSSQLDALCLAFRQSCDSDEVCGVCVDAVKVLRTGFAGVGERRESGNCLGFAVNVDEEFVRLLEGNCEEALVVLGWFCVLLDELGDVWWGEGWAEKILSSVEGLLGEKWVGWVRWPCEVVREGRKGERRKSGVGLVADV